MLPGDATPVALPLPVATVGASELPVPTTAASSAGPTTSSSSDVDGAPTASDDGYTDEMAIASLATITGGEATTIAPGTNGGMPVAAATEVFAVPPATAALQGLSHSYQSWNNCGPATIDMALSAWGLAAGQAQAATRLKPDPDDKNVSPEELARYAREVGAAARVLYGGDGDTLRRLVAAGIPVIVETWFVPDPGDEMGHYRVLTGYEGQTFIFHDSYAGPGLRVDEAASDELWRVFNRAYLPVYDPAAEPTVRTAVGAVFDDQELMWTKVASEAQQEVAERGDAFAYFNLGSALVELGDHRAAAAAFDQARAVGLPWRMLWYQFGPFEAYAAVGRWDDVLALAEANLSNAANLEESLYWRGRARSHAGDSEAAEADWQLAARLNPFFQSAVDALANRH